MQGHGIDDVDEWIRSEQKRLIPFDRKCQYDAVFGQYLSKMPIRRICLWLMYTLDPVCTALTDSLNDKSRDDKANKGVSPLLEDVRTALISIVAADLMRGYSNAVSAYERGFSNEQVLTFFDIIARTMIRLDDVVLSTAVTTKTSMHPAHLHTRNLSDECKNLTRFARTFDETMAVGELDTEQAFAASERVLRLLSTEEISDCSDMYGTQPPDDLIREVLKDCRFFNAEEVITSLAQLTELRNTSVLKKLWQRVSGG